MYQHYEPMARPDGCGNFVATYLWSREDARGVCTTERAVLPLRPVAESVALKIAARHIRNKLNKPLTLRHSASRNWRELL